MTMLLEEKQALRNEIKRIRRGLSERERAYAADAMFNRLRTWDTWQSANTVMAFVSMPDEVPTHSLLVRILEDGKELILPRCRKGEPLFDAVPVTHLGNQLVPGPLKGLRDPSPDLPTIPDYERIDLILVPGLAFDRLGGRLGYGKGMYDQFLASASFGTTLGLAFELQVVDKVPMGEHDHRLDYLLTESNLTGRHH